MVTVHCNGLGLVHAGLRRYIFRDPSARGCIISHNIIFERFNDWSDRLRSHNLIPSLSNTPQCTDDHELDSSFGEGGPLYGGPRQPLPCFHSFLGRYTNFTFKVKKIVCQWVAHLQWRRHDKGLAAWLAIAEFSTLFPPSLIRFCKCAWSLCWCKRWPWSSMNPPVIHLVFPLLRRSGLRGWASRQRVWIRLRARSRRKVGWDV